MEASTDMINSTTLVVTAMPVSSASSAAGGGCGGAGNATAGSPTAALGTAASAVNSANRAVADKRSACRLWRWVARIDGLCEERRKREETEGFTVDGGVGGGVGVAWPSTEIAGYVTRCIGVTLYSMVSLRLLVPSVFPTTKIGFPFVAAFEGVPSVRIRYCEVLGVHLCGHAGEDRVVLI